MWLPAAIKRRQQLENKRAGGGALGQLPCFRVGLYFSGEALSGCSDERTGGEDMRKGGERDSGMKEEEEKEVTETDRRQKDATNSN